jgi:DnaA family protein
MKTLMPEQLPLGVGLRDEATLENFLTRDNNLAVRAVEALANESGETCLYLWGAPGSGCTHLLQAACQRAVQLQRQSFYLPLENLIEYGPEILDDLEAMDLVCIDGLELIAGQRLWEEALFHLFNRLRDAGRSLLLAAHTPPRQLQVALPDLLSRLNWSLVIQLQGLDDAGKLEALSIRAKARGIELTDEVGSYILHRSPREMSRLFELLELLDLASLTAKRKLTIPFVKETLGW